MHVRQAGTPPCTSGRRPAGPHLGVTHPPVPASRAPLGRTWASKGSTLPRPAGPHLGVKGVHLALHEHAGQHQVLQALHSPPLTGLVVALL